MSRTRSSAALRIAGLLAGAALLFAACSSAGASGTPAASAPPASVAPSSSAAAADVYTVKVAQDSKLGAYLVGEDGKSLYLFTNDSKDTTTCTGACATAWPPFELEGSESVAAGDGVAGTLATITRADDGKKQVTYNGIPLYYFAKDTKAGDVNGQGIKGVWFLVGAASTAASGTITGGVGQTAAAPSTAPSAAPTTAGAADSVKIANFAFSPATITVKVGSSITWTNTDSAGHTVTADDGTFDSGTLSNGATFSQAFSKTGTFTYHCAIHSSMKATVTVTQ